MDMTLKIAGSRTIGDWVALRKSLEKNPSEESLWREAFGFFESRITTRYLNPIEAIERGSDIEGEGFAITAIICSLIETMETFRLGKAYRRASREKPLDNETEYFRSQEIFEDFLKKHEPFKAYFSTGDLATSFYENVRCAVLHEAATRGGWRIRIDTSVLLEVRGDSFVLNRNLFVQAITQYMSVYKTELLLSNELKSAFIRKFDSICATA